MDLGDNYQWLLLAKYGRDLTSPAFWQLYTASVIKYSFPAPQTKLESDQALSWQKL